MLDFFDPTFFSEKCTCESPSNRGHCELHQKHIPSIQPEHVMSTAEEERSIVPKVEINQSFPRQPAQDYLTRMIEYRIRMLSSYGEMIRPGEIKKIRTNVTVTRKSGKLSILLKCPENLPLRFISEGLLSPAFRGNLSVCFENSTSENIYLSPGSSLGYLVLTPFIQWLWTVRISKLQ